MKKSKFTEQQTVFAFYVDVLIDDEIELPKKIPALKKQLCKVLFLLKIYGLKKFL